MNETDRKRVAILVKDVVNRTMHKPELGQLLQLGELASAVQGEVYVALADVVLSGDAPRVGTAPSAAALGLPAAPREADEAFQRERALAHERDRLLYQIANVVSGMAAYHSQSSVRNSAVDLGRCMKEFEGAVEAGSGGTAALGMMGTGGGGAR